ncbi:MAG: hypothetical protein M3539_01830 [Acidobacteriota bacterium]|nr:hypothetical protein [Acidobacteriota bacterium]
MKLIWIALSVICIVAAALLLARGNLDGAFVVATIGALCWFLNYRTQLKEITRAADLERERDDSDEV